MRNSEAEILYTSCSYCTTLRVATDMLAQSQSRAAEDGNVVCVSDNVHLEIEVATLQSSLQRQKNLLARPLQETLLREHARCMDNPELWYPRKSYVLQDRTSNLLATQIRHSIPILLQSQSLLTPIGLPCLLDLLLSL
jgi:hypothetical protein